jgi:hypothetical protein
LDAGTGAFHERITECGCRFCSRDGSVLVGRDDAPEQDGTFWSGATPTLLEGARETFLIASTAIKSTAAPKTMLANLTWVEVLLIFFFLSRRYYSAVSHERDLRHSVGLKNEPR